MTDQISSSTNETDEEFDRGVDMGYMHAFLLHRLARGGDRDAIIAQFYTDFDEEFQFTDEERTYIESDETYGIDIN